MTLKFPRVRSVPFVGGCLFAAALPVFASDPIEDVGNTVREWVRTRAETVQLENRWNEERALLGSTVNGLKERASRLEDRRDELLSATAEERKELSALEAKREEAQASLRTAEARLQQVTAELIELRSQLPPRLSEALEMAYRSLAGSSASPGERMQLVMTVLNRCTQFNAGISHGEEVIHFDGEPAPKSVEVIYWGLSHGYALDRSTRRAWFGTPSAGRWRWEPLEGATAAVAELIAVRLDESDPELVAVPARLKTVDSTVK